MIDNRLTHRTIQNEMMGRVVWHTLTGPLLPVWVTGIALLLIFFHQPLLAMVWTGALLGLSFLMVRDNLQSHLVCDRFVRSIIQKRFSPCRLSDPSMKSTLEYGVNTFTEIAVKVIEIERKGGPDDHLRRLIPLSDAAVYLLWQSAREAEELGRGLKLAEGQNGNDASFQTVSLEAGGADTRRRESIAAAHREMERARSSLDDIAKCLETLMLQLFQIEHLPSDAGRCSELAREAEEMLNNLKRQSDFRGADRYAPDELKESRKVLESGLSQAGSSEGLKVLQRLVSEYAQLQPLLDRPRTTDSLSTASINLMAEEIYRQGLTVLQDALELLRTVRPSEKERLETEALQLEQRIEALRKDESQKERLKLMDETLNSHLERLDIMRKQQLRIEELFHLSGRCEASLHRTRMEIAGMKAADSEAIVKPVMENLESTINGAKEVHEELKKLGF